MFNQLAVDNNTKIAAHPEDDDLNSIAKRTLLKNEGEKINEGELVE